MRDGEKASPDLPFEKNATSRRSTTRPGDSDITALPFAKPLEQSPHLRPVSNEHAISYNFQLVSHSQSSLPRERRKLLRPQSLRASGPESTFLRRRSSKRKPHNSIREEEIRAMSLPLPQKRSATTSQGMLHRDSKKVKGPLNWHFERPTSNISLPLADSIDSSMSSGSGSRAFRVSALDMLSPRPKIRCLVGSQHFYNSTQETPTSPLTNNLLQQELEKTGGREHSKRTSRIDDLADTLDAGALRQILERDKRRREAKRKADDERLRRKLERRAEKQRAADRWAASQRAAEPPVVPSASPNGAAGELVGLGIDNHAPEPMEDVRPSTPQPSDQQVAKLQASIPTHDAQDNAQLPTPVQSPVQSPVEAPSGKTLPDPATSAPPTPQTHARGPSNVSDLPALLSEKVPQPKALEMVESIHDRRASGSLHPVTSVATTATSRRGSSRRFSFESGRMAVFTSLFRRGKRGSQDQGFAPPSEVSFSNTSRESMSRQPLPSHLVDPTQQLPAHFVAPSQPVQIKKPSSAPRRTMSKFREDLPEYPLSPPESRMQSPEVTVAPSTIAARRRSEPLSALNLSAASPDTDTTESPISPGAPASGLMSQSLASVDSEGSWLSGKPMKRRSNRSQVRSSVSSSAMAKRNDDFNTSYEELGIPDDEYFKQLTSRPDIRGSAVSGEHMARKASSTAMAAIDAAPEDDYEEEVLPIAHTSSDEELAKGDVARRPTLVNRRTRVKSTEGLVSYFQPDRSSVGEERSSEERVEPESPFSDSEPIVVHRAQSVDLGKHHSRQLSAGSAKLLDIPARRASADPKRSSLSSQNTLMPQ
ncbi:hypothetical protein M011DRAFT_474659 [Sporormia fimetaria CBS 119925]|uniref:Uncharacterized protein n=1 Tax=Sporormia fimetaria CBS 119925 TaxID=1340428 RepID=A0A6A6VHU2_9PLEO|nr:hypothetical protein M011DRAFT_474659 [Sporormia fimetaria CBS 119925]